MNGDNITKDAFLDGAFFVLQPASGAHRSGIDALLLSASVSQKAKGLLVADLGAGCGVAGLAVAQRNQLTSVDLVEVDPTMVSLALRSLKLRENKHLGNRVNVISADVLASGKDRKINKLIDNKYDHVIANPPYNTTNFHASDYTLKAKAHVLKSGGLEGWFKTATSILKSSGQFSVILRPDSLSTALNALTGRMGNISVCPIHAKSGEPASRIIITATKGSRAPFQLMSGKILHKKSACYALWAENIFRGR
ncbi:tRNA1(Val) (adenine(37)-N6)-methyltransferase [Candidatus Endowatersipora endosymbiont of Watersipora subatra]|uniref:tRNA1(Val) (adenine(37)-N6)-methyltransferase n=1 Tax=Candidatus Endowatersipora endosymbiont of Watersipora subatra TaxID=3077946 RepID=UPI00312C9263